MSRGPGKLQAAIIEHVRASEAPTTLETMRWVLYEPVKGRPVPVDELPGTWNSSFTRAVHELAAEPRLMLEIERRPLASLEECVEHFPNKTLDRAARDARLALLPALLEWANDKHGPGPHYSAASNEEYHVNRFEPEERRTISRDWLALEDDLVTVHAKNRTNELFHLIAKGRSLFTKTSLQDRTSFAYYLQMCKELGQLPDDLSARLRQFTESVLPPTQAGFLRLKSFIHSFASLPSRGPFTLKQPTMDALHERRKAFVEALPGFVPPSDASRRFGYGPKHSDQLRYLLDKSALQAFQFVRLAG